MKGFRVACTWRLNSPDIPLDSIRRGAGRPPGEAGVGLLIPFADAVVTARRRAPLVTDDGLGPFLKYTELFRELKGLVRVFKVTGRAPS